MMCRRASSWFYLIAVFLTAVLTVAAEDVDECEPAEMCSDGFVGDFVRDPLDCHNYYVCITAADGNLVPSDQPVPCEDKYYFNGTDCVKEGGTTCINFCRNKDCLAECPDGVSTVIAYPGDCSKYYVCLPDGEVVAVDCDAEAPYFDGITCTEDPYSCCDICTPYCEEQYTEVMDPEDCTGYYLCLNDGEYSPDPETEHFNCDPGHHFDSSLGQCTLDEDGVPCTSLCSNITLSNF